MRLLGGELRSRRVSAPPGRAVRPTPARVKEALFSILGRRIVDARVLDLYAGSGALGFEALSRGARAATFVEAHAPTARAIAATAAALGVSARTTIMVTRAERVVARLRGERYDVIFADPPYALPPPAELFTRLATAALAPGGLLVYEHSSRRRAPLAIPGLALLRRARYGTVELAFLEAATLTPATAAAAPVATGDAGG
jgi:16S rRNA (guanine966-N2)-methyltransferase